MTSKIKTINSISVVCAALTLSKCCSVSRPSVRKVEHVWHSALDNCPAHCGILWLSLHYQAQQWARHTRASSTQLWALALDRCQWACCMSEVNTWHFCFLVKWSRLLLQRCVITQTDKELLSNILSVSEEDYLWISTTSPSVFCIPAFSFLSRARFYWICIIKVIFLQHTTPNISGVSDKNLVFYKDLFTDSVHCLVHCSGC